MSNDNASQPRGINGHKPGQYAEVVPTPPTDVIPNRDPAEVFGAVKGRGNGLWDIQSAQSEIRPIDGMYRIPLGGEPRTNTRIGAALRLFSEDDREETQDAFLDLARDGDGVPAHHQVTVLVGDGNTVRAIEGTTHVEANGQVLLWCKGSKTKYYPFGEGSSKLGNLVAFRKGYGKQHELAAEFDKVIAQVPVTEIPTFDGIPDRHGEFLDEDVEETIAAVYLIDGHDFGNGAEPGCMFLATDIQTDAGIVNGYFWAPSDAGLLTSEFSSCYVEDLWAEDGRRRIQKGLVSLGGRVRDYEPGSYTASDAWKTLSEDRARGYREILGR